MKYEGVELAVFHLPNLPEDDRWFATQNLCPHKQAMSMSRSLVGQHPSGVLTVADPIYKTTYDLRTGAGIANANFNLSTFSVKEDGGRVYVKVPAADHLLKAFDEQIGNAYAAAGKERKKRLGGEASDEKENMKTETKTNPKIHRFMPVVRTDAGLMDW